MRLMLSNPVDMMDSSPMSRRRWVWDRYVTKNCSRNAISNICASTHAGGSGTTATIEGASGVAGGSTVEAKSDDDSGDGDGDPDSDRHKKRHSFPRFFVPSALVQRTVPRRILRMPEVVAKVGLSRSTIYAKLKAKEFVSPVQLGARAIGFFESDVDAWLESRSLVSVAA